MGVKVVFRQTSAQHMGHLNNGQIAIYSQGSNTTYSQLERIWKTATDWKTDDIWLYIEGEDGTLAWVSSADVLWVGFIDE